MTTTATPDNWTVAMVMKGPAKIYAGVSIPGTNARLTLHTDGSPDATTNIAAVHLGMTEAGCEFMVKGKPQDFFADEFPNPILSSIESVECAITGTFLQGMDLTKLGEILTPGVGTYATSTGYKQLQLGRRAIVYNSIVAIAPQDADPTKFIVFHLYSALNDAGLAAQLSRKKLSGTPFAFKGYDVPARAVTDTCGNFWVQI